MSSLDLTVVAAYLLGVLVLAALTPGALTLVGYYGLGYLPRMLLALALGLAGAINALACRQRVVVWLSAILLAFPMGRSLILVKPRIGAPILSGP